MPTDRILAIDPGNRESAYVIADVWDYRPLEVGKVPNEEMLAILRERVSGGKDAQEVAIEMVSSYGMPVGRDVFETCVWIGRFLQLVASEPSGIPVRLVYRIDVKRHVCYLPTARDSNITQALVDRFAPGAPNRGKGTKKEPGWFYGFKADIWQAYALAVTYIDREMVMNW